MPLVSIGIDHRTAPVEVREALAFDAEQARRFLTESADAMSERLLLSTCNRTEFFAVPHPGAEDPAAELEALLHRARGVALDGHRRVYRESDSVRHLFRVACGIESMVLGETQILGQVKNAGELAVSVGAAGPILRKLLDTSARVAKRARAETAIGEGAVSIASASVELAKKVFGDLDGRTALVVGVGETGRLVAQHLRRAGAGKLLLANRTLGRAKEVAEEVSAEPWGLCGVPPGLRQADIVVTATSAERPILTADEVRAAMRARKGRMLLLLDIAVPRDVEPDAAKSEGVILYDVDALRSIVDRNLTIRRKAVSRVEEMIEEAVAGFLAWERGLSVVPAIKALRTRFEEIRREELAQNLKRIPPEAREQAERLSVSLLNRLLHEPTLRLKQAGKEPGGGRELIAALRELFRIEERHAD